MRTRTCPHTHTHTHTQNTHTHKTHTHTHKTHTTHPHKTHTKHTHTTNTPPHTPSLVLLPLTLLLSACPCTPQRRAAAPGDRRRRHSLAALSTFQCCRP